MKFEVGKFYRTRDGRKAKVVYINTDLSNAYMIYAEVDKEDRLVTYTLSGTLWENGDTSDYDLIAPWEEPKQPKKLYAYRHALEHTVSFYEHELIPDPIARERAPEYDLEYPGGENDG